MIIEWNESMSLPENLHSIEELLTELENSAKVLTEYLTTYDNFWQFLFGFVVIAVIPAIGEEYTFRGLMQNFMKETFKNAHLAIWITGFVFSFIHFQFYGFLPRMLLGVLFGYLYHWSGTLWVPILAHFLNNGITVVMVHLYNIQALQYNIEDAETPGMAVVATFSVICSLLLYGFYRVSKNRSLGF